MAKIIEVHEASEIVRALGRGTDRFGRQIIFRITKHETIQFRLKGKKTWTELSLVAAYQQSLIGAAKKPNRNHFNKKVFKV